MHSKHVAKNLYAFTKPVVVPYHESTTLLLSPFLSSFTYESFTRKKLLRMKSESVSITRLVFYSESSPQNL